MDILDKLRNNEEPDPEPVIDDGDKSVILAPNGFAHETQVQKRFNELNSNIEVTELPDRNLGRDIIKASNYAYNARDEWMEIARENKVQNCADGCIVIRGMGGTGAIAYEMGRPTQEMLQENQVVNITSTSHIAGINGRETLATAVFYHLLKKGNTGDILISNQGGVNEHIPYDEFPKKAGYLAATIAKNDILNLHSQYWAAAFKPHDPSLHIHQVGDVIRQQLRNIKPWISLDNGSRTNGSLTWWCSDNQIEMNDLIDEVGGEGYIVLPEKYRGIDIDTEIQEYSKIHTVEVEYAPINRIWTAILFPLNPEIVEENICEAGVMWLIDAVSGDIETEIARRVKREWTNYANRYYPDNEDPGDALQDFIATLDRRWG